MKVTLLFLGSTGAGPVYSLEMAKSIIKTGQCHMQLLISKQVSNYKDWDIVSQNSDVELIAVDTYKHNKISFAIGLLQFWKINKIEKAIKGFNPDCLYVPFLLTWDFLLYPRLYQHMRIIATLHDPHPHDVSRSFLYNWLLKKNKKAYKYVDDVIILNKHDEKFVKDNYCTNVHIIPHASFSYYVAERKVDNQIKNTIGFIGRIEPYKGLDLLINAFLKLDSKYKLIIAGSGKINEEIVDTIKNNKRIELINRYIKDDEFSGIIDRMDLVVLPYKRASQSGVIPLVFAHGKTVIATNVGALEEQCPNGTGLIVEPNVSSIVNAISTLYKDPSLILSYGEAAKRYADSELTWDSSAAKFLNIIFNNSLYE